MTRAEELGFDSVWMEEHHAVTDHYWPSPLTVLAGFATRTSRVLLGTDIAVAPFHHPVRLAEDVAMLDVMSNGRAVLGVAIGYKPDEFALYGADLAQRGARFEEQLAIVKGLWTEERFSFRGAYYTVDGRLEPKPIAQPHPPLWIGGWGALTLRRAATLADNWIPGPTADLARLLNGQRAFLDHRRAAGRTAAYRGVAADPRRDHRRHGPARRASSPSATSWWPTARSTRAAGATPSSTPASPPTSIASWRIASSSAGPSNASRRSGRFVEQYGMTHLICRTFFPGMPHAHIMRESELLASEVRPAFE